MSIEVNFTSDSKRENSTKQRTYGNPQNCVLKNGCSMLNPTLLLELDSESFPAYTGLSFGSRKYNILDVRSVRNNLFEVDGRVDVLETYKSTILGSTQFVAYSTNSYNKFITDSRVGLTDSHATQQTILSSILPIFDSDGVYILGVIDNQASGLTGAITYYVLSDVEYEFLLQEINGQGYIDSFLASVSNAFSNPFEAIVSSIWMPIRYDKIVGTPGSTMTLINKPVLITPKRITSPRVACNWNIVGYSPNDNYLDLAPFTTHSLYLPFVGNIPLDLDAVYPRNPILSCEVDILTGHLAYIIKLSDSDQQGFLATYSGFCGVNVPINNQVIDTKGVLAGAILTIGGAVSAAMAPEAYAAASAMGAAASAISAVKSAELHSQTNGALSSRVGAFLGLSPIQTTIATSPTEPFGNSAQSRGLPLFRRVSLANLTGYVQTRGASIDGAMTSEERRELNTLLDTGIFIE